MGHFDKNLIQFWLWFYNHYGMFLTLMQYINYTDLIPGQNARGWCGARTLKVLTKCLTSTMSCHFSHIISI